MNGADMQSEDIQKLLNEGVVSPQHDSLVNDGLRSVLGCALVSSFWPSIRKML